MRGILPLIGLIVFSSASACADDAANQLTLADLAAYRLALSGKATASDARANDPPIQASFRDLWDKTDALRGRRVSIRGRIQRVFHQGAVGQFPALVQAWAFSPSGDPFCLVYSDVANVSTSEPGQVPGPLAGKDIQFTGTFLKVVEYPATDGARLAPLIVGDKPAMPLKLETSNPGPTNKSSEVSTGSWASTDWIIGFLAALGVVGILGLRHLGPAKPPRKAGGSDPPLEFVSSDSESASKGTS